MDDFMEEVKKLYVEIDRIRDLLPFVKLIGDHDLNRRSNAISDIQVVINRSIQMGNYRRAIRYTVVLKRIVKELNRSEKQIKECITKKVFKFK